jgi:type II secretory pathway pseudopilin PulG
MVVVIAVFGLLAGATAMSFLSNRKKQNTALAQTQMITMLRRLQSAALSARNLPDGKSASMYVLKISRLQPSKHSNHLCLSQSRILLFTITKKRHSCSTSKQTKHSYHNNHFY